MAVVKGTSAGFVVEAPTANPAGWNLTQDSFSTTVKDTSSATAVKVTEIGWYCDNATEESNYEVGVYDHDSGNDRPNDLVGVSRTNAKGTTSGWKRVTGLNITISTETIYWLGIQLDDTTTATNSNFGSAGGERYSPSSSGSLTLPNPWTAGGFDNFIVSIYAVWEAEEGTNCQINIADDWKEVDSIQINIGDVWKDVSAVQVNIGDAWKDVF